MLFPMMLMRHLYQYFHKTSMLSLYYPYSESYYNMQDLYSLSYNMIVSGEEVVLSVHQYSVLPRQVGIGLAQVLHRLLHIATTTRGKGNECLALQLLKVVVNP